MPDNLLNTDVLIGQSPTELPTVTALKTSSKLTLYCDNSKTDRMNPYNSNSASVDGIKCLTVHSKDKYTGNLFYFWECMFTEFIYLIRTTNRDTCLKKIHTKYRTK